MSVKTWTLLDVAEDRHVDYLELGAAELGAGTNAGSVSLGKRTLRGGLRDGVEVVDIDNGRLSFTLVPTRGMGIWRARCGDLPLGWNSPVTGPVHPRHVPLSHPGGIGWLEGFDELLCRCGLENNGAPEWDEQGRLAYGLHGRIANLPAHRLEAGFDDTSGELFVTGVVDEGRLFGNKLRLTSTVKTRIDSCEITVQDRVTNLSGETGRVALLYHINFGPPLLEAGARVHFPVATVCPCNGRAAEGLAQWDTYAAEEPGFEEQVYFFDLLSDDAHRTEVLLHNAGADRGVGLEFDMRQLPCFTLWKSTQPAGDGYVTGLEPGVNLPNAPRFEQSQGRIRGLAPGASLETEVTLRAYPDGASVQAAADRIATLQGGTSPRVLDTPQPPYAPK
jgi:hypothetical protein